MSHDDLQVFFQEMLQELEGLIASNKVYQNRDDKYCRAINF